MKMHIKEREIPIWIVVISAVSLALITMGTYISGIYQEPPLSIKTTRYLYTGFITGANLCIFLSLFDKESQSLGERSLWLICGTLVNLFAIPLLLITLFF